MLGAQLVEPWPRGAGAEGRTARSPAQALAPPRVAAPLGCPRTMLLPRLWLPLLLAGLLPLVPAQKFSALTVSPGPRGAEQVTLEGQVGLRLVGARCVLWGWTAASCPGRGVGG